MKTWKTFSRMPLALLTGSLLLGAGQVSLAADSTAGLTPEVLFHFTGDDRFGTHWGKDPLVPPVMGNDGNLYGGTQFGDGTLRNGAVQVGIAYVFNPATGTYTPSSMGELGALYSPLIKNSSGVVYGGVRFSSVDNIGSLWGKGLIYTQNTEGATRFAVPVDGLTPNQAGVQPGGQMALDGEGNLYLGVGQTTGACTATSDVQNNLYRVTAEGVFERLINLCHFRSGGVDAASQIQPYGSGAIAYLWSETESALYVLATVATSSSTNGVRPEATLLRISKTNLDKGLANNGVVAETDIELLHTFSSGAGGGVPQGTNVRLSSLVEDGDWIYGTSFYDGRDVSTLRGSGNVWRINKKQAGSFTVVHHFRAGASIDTKTADPADGTDAADGFQPSGPLVLAADGNLYGTTLSDGRTYTEMTTGNAANIGRKTLTGAGTVFRVKVGVSADRSDDTVEILHRFDVATQGKSPAGLSAGAIANGAQTLYGVTREGENTTANGALYKLAVPLDGTGSLALTAGAIEVAAGETVSLGWSNPWLTQNCSLDLKEGTNNLSALGGDGDHLLADLLARTEAVDGVTISGDLASGSISFPLTANASYELSCPEPFAGYQGELLSQRVAFTLLAASSSSSEASSSAASTSSSATSSVNSSASSSANSSAVSSSSSSRKSGGGGGSAGLLVLGMLSLLGMAKWAGRNKV